eukprot:CAMPEP_0177681560 /NCGR_PEP_ID=MMETSP0447-20121125/30787_1 /TAXON_ID=0 /ORGANISM="Stygamoeba regulata, Strain BSH-02190019" /LENGTH=41 /DNA_ID= /DNA_START= /DNA_END= /DNA_ORIENTATION=
MRSPPFREGFVDRIEYWVTSLSTEDARIRLSSGEKQAITMP